MTDRQDAWAALLISTQAQVQHPVLPGQRFSFRFTVAGLPAIGLIVGQEDRVKAAVLVAPTRDEVPEHMTARRYGLAWALGWFKGEVHGPLLRSDTVLYYGNREFTEKLAKEYRNERP